MTKTDIKLITFLKGRGRLNGFNIYDMQKIWSDKELETKHNWAQDVFPTKEQSKYKPSAYHFSNDFTIKEVPAKDLKIIRDNMRISVKRYLRMLGFNYSYIYDDIEDLVYDKSPNNIKITFLSKAVLNNWTTHHTHNYLRLTRMLKSLILFEMWADVKAVSRLLTELSTMVFVPERTVDIWNHVINQAERKGATKTNYQIDWNGNKGN